MAATIVSVINSYPYIPLASGSSEFRLVDLQPGSPGSSIECSLQHDFLANKPVYEALSYAWGDPKTTRSIVLDGAHFTVTVNLEIALRHLRLEDKVRTLWIDAICIDQGNIPERNEQVKSMRNIYTLAKSVIAWIGEASEDSDKAMALVQEASDFSDRYGLDFEPTPEYMRESGFDISTKNWSALEKLWQRPYWNRIWVIQEMSSSGDVLGLENRCTIRCGHNTLALRSHIVACVVVRICLMRLPFMPVDANDAEEYLKGMAAAMTTGSAVLMKDAVITAQVERFKAMPVTYLMNKLRSFQSTDPRDKLYAILGLTRKEDWAIVPDYSKSAVEVYIDLVRFLVNYDHNLDALSGNRQGRNEFGPSWIPELYGVAEMGPSWVNERRQHRASGSLEADISISTKVHNLHARGVGLGTLDILRGPFSAKGGLVNIPFVELFEVLDEHENSLGTDLDEVAWRTLIMDNDFDQFNESISPAPEALGLPYKVARGLAPMPDTFEPDLPEMERFGKFFRPWERNASMCLINRTFFITACGRMGLGPYGAKKGDIVVILYGGGLCFVLRPKGDQFELIGDAYVHGVMKGELFEGPNGDKHSKEQIFTLC